MDHFNPALNGVLLHAPWPFKTITGALAYIAPIMPLPYSSPITGMIWEYAIIHLMPGRYSASQGQYGHNGLFGNGETFPLYLPQRVSIQGTSALNTVFDLSDGGPAFWFGANATNTGEYSWIDSVSFFAAPNDDESFPRNNSAIFVDGVVASSPSVTNCFFFGNGIGVLIMNQVQSPVSSVVTLINNTFAWNVVNLWNGQVAAPSIGVTPLVLINNIFDVTPPPGFSPPPRWSVINAPPSDFEGVDLTDVLVLPLGVDYNAYETGKYNTGGTWPLMGLTFPTGVRLANIPTPGIDIAPYTGGTTGTPRGVLYVRDALFNAPPAVFQVSPTAGFDLSPGDFRLCPDIALASAAAIPPATPNILVNAGWAGPFPATMLNGVVMTNAPGTLPSAGWVFTNWAHDCEGFGNPRIYAHPAYPPGAASNMDIGADEVGELIAVGQRFGTTHFFEDGPPTGPTQDNKYVWWFGPNHSPPLNQNLRPDYTYVWLDQWAYGTILGRPYYWPSLCDISPHLLPDAHPWWLGLVGGPTNPIWQFWRFPALYNAALYVAPLVGVINPPGALYGYSNPLPPNQQYRWLDGVGNPAPTQFAYGGPGTFFMFGAWCQATGTAQDYDIVPSAGLPTLAWRFSVEFPTTTPYNAFGGSNLQSFLVKRL